MDTPQHCPGCRKPLTYRAGLWACSTPHCANHPATVTTLLDERGRPTNMRGWRAGLNKKGKR